MHPFPINEIMKILHFPFSFVSCANFFLFTKVDKFYVGQVAEESRCTDLPTVIYLINRTPLASSGIVAWSKRQDENRQQAGNENEGHVGTTESPLLAHVSLAFIVLSHGCTNYLYLEFNLRALLCL